MLKCRRNVSMEFEVYERGNALLQKFPSGLPRLFLDPLRCERGKFRNRSAGGTSQGARYYFG